MEVVPQKRTSGKASRRDVLKGGAALGASLGVGQVFSPRIARAAGLIPVKVINAAGNFSKMEEFLLVKLGLFEKYGVDAEQIDVADTNKILAGLIGGDGDLCPASGYSTLFPAIEKGGAVKILAGSSLAPLNILYSARPDIKSVKDLPGRTVGTGAPGALLHELAVADMKKYGVDYKQVRVVKVGGSSDVFKALVAGTIDAGVGPIDFSDTAGKYNLTVIPDGQFWKELPLWVNQAMYTSDRAIASNRRGIVGVMAAYADMFGWLQNPANRQAWMTHYKEVFPNSTVEEATFLLNFVSAPGRLSNGLVLSKEQIDYVQSLNVELEVQKAILPFDKCTDISLAQEALKLVNG